MGVTLTGEDLPKTALKPLDVLLRLPGKVLAGRAASGEPFATAAASPVAAVVAGV
jgi:hypothetical protein